MAAIRTDAIDVAKANNPLADLNAFNFQNYYSTSLYGSSGETANTMNLRPVVVAGRHIVRATLPIQTTPVGVGVYYSGLGDFSIFDAHQGHPNRSSGRLAPQHHPNFQCLVEIEPREHNHCENPKPRNRPREPLPMFPKGAQRSPKSRKQLAADEGPTGENLGLISFRSRSARHSPA